MKIIYIDDIFHPDAGYQANLLSKYWVKFGHEVYIFTSEMSKIPSGYTNFFNTENLDCKDKNFEHRTGVKIQRFPLLTYISGRSVYEKSIFQSITANNPDVVFVNGNDSLIGIQLIRNYKKYNYGLVTDSHMLEMASTNRFNRLFRRYYRTFITPIILENDIPVIRAQDDSYVEKCLGIPLERCPWISFGSDTDIFYPNEDKGKRFREENNIKDNDFVIIYAGKIIESKGAAILAKAMQSEINSDREIVFLIVGTAEGKFGKEIEEEFSKAKYRVLRFPTQKYYDLPRFYQAADIAVFPKQCSLSFYDVQSCGLPVVFEDNNINADRSQFGNAITYETDNIKDFCRKIECFANMGKEEFDEYSHNAFKWVKENYNYETKAKEYIPYLMQQARVKDRF